MLGSTVSLVTCHVASNRVDIAAALTPDGAKDRNLGMALREKPSYRAAPLIIWNIWNIRPCGTGQELGRYRLIRWRRRSSL
jgi:hypothetical protein